MPLGLSLILNPELRLCLMVSLSNGAQDEDEMSCEISATESM